MSSSAPEDDIGHSESEQFRVGVQMRTHCDFDSELIRRSWGPNAAPVRGIIGRHLLRPLNIIIRAFLGIGDFPCREQHTRYDFVEQYNMGNYLGAAEISGEHRQGTFSKILFFAHGVFEP